MKKNQVLTPNKISRLFLILGLIVLFRTTQVIAQEDQPAGPIYIVQPGDTLWGISRIFNLNLDDLAAFNGMDDPSQLAVGAQLAIPGMDGLEGVLVIESIPYGENLRSLSRRYQVPMDVISRLNQFTTPDDVAAGATFITLDQGDEIPAPAGGRAVLRSGTSLLEMAIVQNSSPWLLTWENDFQGIRDVLPGEVLYLSNTEKAGPGALPEVITAVQMEPFPGVQGKTLVVRVIAAADIVLTGEVAERELNFFPYEGGYIALQGIHAMLAQGYYPSTISGVLEDGTSFSFSQKIFIQDGGYPFDPPLVVNSETVDVENTQPEDFEWFATVAPITPERMWVGGFVPPVPAPLKDCYPSLFGNRRSYNGSAYQFFHTGLDFCGSEGVEIYAPAPGRVVLSEPLIVRGNATVIDHGWGVYTAYAHQSEFLVSVGDWVEAGQLIGLVGSTGRVTGPHLHWEVIVGGVQVDPMDWLESVYP